MCGERGRRGIGVGGARWPFVSSHIPAIITITTAVLGLVGAYLKLRPRRFVSWLAAVKERETLLAMLEHAQGMADHWQQEAERCHQALKDRCP